MSPLAWAEVPPGETAGAQESRFRAEFEEEERRKEKSSEEALIIENGGTKSSAAAGAEDAKAPAAETAREEEPASAQFRMEKIQAPAPVPGLEPVAREFTPDLTAASGDADTKEIVTKPKVSPRDYVQKIVRRIRAFFSSMNTRLISFREKVRTRLAAVRGKRAAGEAPAEKVTAEGSAQFAVERLPVIPPPAVPALRPDLTRPAPAPAVSQPTAPSAPTPTTGPAQAPVVPASTLPAGPGIISQVLQPVGPAAPSPEFTPVTLIAQIEVKMQEAARTQDFETAIELRDQMRRLLDDARLKEVYYLEYEMRAAAASLEFEKAIEIRNRIRELQRGIELTVPVPQRVRELIPEIKVPEITFRIQTVEVTGNDLISAAELKAYTDSLIGRDITLTDIKKAASDIKAHYRRKGYVAAYVWVPPQTIRDGSVSLSVIEGRLGKVRVEGNKHFAEPLVQSMVRRWGMEPGEIVTYHLLRDSLQQVNRHRDIEAKAILRPGAEPATTDVLLQLEDRSPLHVSVDTNNFGTRLTGRQRTGATVTHTNLTGNLDELTARFQASEGAYAALLDYNIPVTSYDQRLGFAYVRGDTDLTGDFKALDIEGEAQTYSAYFLQPLWRDDVWTSSARLGFDRKSVENRLLDTPSGRDELRVINTVLNIEETDPYGKTFWPHSFRFGVDAFGASERNDESLTRAGSGAPFFAYRMFLDRFHYLPYGMMLGAHGSVQLSPDELPPSEQFQIGGIGSVRGYPQGEYLGDHGAYIQLEYMTPAYFIPGDWKLLSQKPLRDELKLVGFYDFGMADLRGALPGEAGDKDISGAGVGMRMRLFDKFSARVEWAYPLSEKTSDGSTGVFYYGVSMDLI